MERPSRRTKNVHVKLDSATHAGFKSKLVQLNVSMQDAFEEFAREVAAGVPYSVRIAERVVRQKLKSELDSVGMKPLKNLGRKHGTINELDVETLYDLINEEDNDEVKLPPPTTGRNEAA